MSNVSQDTVREPKQQITTALPPDLWERMRLLAVRRKTTAAALLEEAVSQYIGPAEQEAANAA